ncbi:BRCT domain-containing protein [Lasiodiplodia theobromae]|uniref:BRCT-containing protein 1 n=2 Tax=Lasiodiplodia theobromae TaxID=45133 RepID=A0A5N5DHS0_9PEZI|nr:BRCT domain-containing protein [Lasiodiplodia theobromae]KAB2577418.1 BRCT-containing protein 1 [Lasiodiplodia theobromae]KAF4540441.1 BRCT domain-containing protein [Lasiodiplodia theobromae]KAF9640363.1 BRCT domain-containing protein [Lasiodiplodia theobromae]
MADDTAMDVDPQQDVFASVTFTAIPTADLPLERVDQLQRILEDNGAIYRPLDPTTQRIDSITDFTHIIATTCDFPDYLHALDHFVHVVKPQWIDDSLRRGKPVNPRSHSPDPRLFMSDVMVTCASDIPEGDAEAIIGGVLAMGGQYSSAITKVTTHLVALTLDDDKCALVRAKNLKCKIVLPHWFDDCLKLGKKIVETPYQLPNPPILSRDHTVPIVHYPSDAIKDATTPTPQALPSPVSFSSPNAPRSLRVFSGKRILLSRDLNVGLRIRNTIEELVRAGGGTVVDHIDQADTYVCPYRDGDDYINASQTGKDVGNLSWLYYLITHDLWTSPMRRLLHYPVPRNGIPGFEKYRISISNYVGEARVYLENLTKACGAQFTRAFRQDNTHLVTAHSQSEKCTAAQEWNIHLVNHMWLEESYAKCKEQSLTNPRYTHFPARTNLGEVVGQTQIDRDAVEKYFFKPANAGKAKKSAHDAKAKQTDKSDTLTTKDAMESNVGEGLQAQTTPSMRTTKRAKSDNANIDTPGRAGDGKENETPSTGRGAKSKALSKLHDLAPDIAQYEKEVKRKGGVIYGGRRVKDDAEANSRTKETHTAKRSLEDEDDEDEEDESAEKGPKRKIKRAKSHDSGGAQFLMLSGDSRWVEKPKKETEDRNKLRAIGIHVTQDPEEVTILCAPKIVRTKKFVAALSNAPVVVSTKFLDFCLKEKRVPAPEKFLLSDEEGERRQGIKLTDSIARAEQNRRHLLDGWQIFVTEKVNGGFETFKDIITANGGSCLLWKGRATGIPKRRKVRLDAEGDTSMRSEPLSDDELEMNRTNDKGDTLYLISSTEPDDVKLWPKFRDLARKADMKPRIVKPDWILFVAMAQMIDFDDRWELNDDDASNTKGAKR